MRIFIVFKKSKKIIIITIIIMYDILKKNQMKIKRKTEMKFIEFCMQKVKEFLL